MYIIVVNNYSITGLLLSTHSFDPCLWGESDLPACGPPASFSLHLASSSSTPAGSVHKSRGEMWLQLKKWCVSCVSCVWVLQRGNIVVMDVIWR